MPSKDNNSDDAEKKREKRGGRRSIGSIFGQSKVQLEKVIQRRNNGVDVYSDGSDDEVFNGNSGDSGDSGGQGVETTTLASENQREEPLQSFSDENFMTIDGDSREDPQNSGAESSENPQVLDYSYANNESDWYENTTRAKSSNRPENPNGSAEKSNTLPETMDKQIQNGCSFADLQHQSSQSPSIVVATCGVQATTPMMESCTQLGPETANPETQANSTGNSGQNSVSVGIQVSEQGNDLWRLIGEAFLTGNSTAPGQNSLYQQYQNQFSQFYQQIQPDNRPPPPSQPQPNTLNGGENPFARINQILSEQQRTQQERQYLDQFNKFLADWARYLTALSIAQAPPTFQALPTSQAPPTFQAPPTSQAPPAFQTPPTSQAPSTYQGQSSQAPPTSQVQSTLQGLLSQAPPTSQAGIDLQGRPSQAPSTSQASSIFQFSRASQAPPILQDLQAPPTSQLAPPIYQTPPIFQQQMAYQSPLFFQFPPNSQAPPTYQAPPPPSQAPPTYQAPPPPSQAPPSRQAPPPPSQAPPTYQAPPPPSQAPPSRQAPPPPSQAPPTRQPSISRETSFIDVVNVTAVDPNEEQESLRSSPILSGSDSIQLDDIDLLISLGQNEAPPIDSQISTSTPIRRSSDCPIRIQISSSSSSDEEERIADRVPPPPPPPKISKPKKSSKQEPAPRRVLSGEEEEKEERTSRRRSLRKSTIESRKMPRRANGTWRVRSSDTDEDEDGEEAEIPQRTRPVGRPSKSGRTPQIKSRNQSSRVESSSEEPGGEGDVPAKRVRSASASNLTAAERIRKDLAIDMVNIEPKDPTRRKRQARDFYQAPGNLKNNKKN